MIRKEVPLLFLFLCLHVAPGFSQDSSRTLIEEFKPSAVATSLGGSLVAQTRDPSAIYWNPALLTGLLDREILMSVNEPFEFDFVGFSQFIPLYGTLGVAWARDRSGGATVDRGTVAWARRFMTRLSFGINLNVQKHAEDWFASSTIGLAIGNPKVGTLENPWRTYVRSAFLDRFTLGFVLRNVPLGDQLFETSGEVGLSYVFPKLGFLINSGYNLRKGKDIGHLGIGFELPRSFTFYSGVADFDMDAFGIGMAYTHDNFVFNLAYSAATSGLLFTLSSRISPAPSQLARPYYAEASTHYRNKNYKKASRLYRQYLDFDIRDDRTDTAYVRVRVLEKKLARDQILIDSLFTVTVKLLAQGETQYLRAALILTKILDLDPDNLKARTKLAHLRPHVDSFVKRSIADGVFEFEAERYFQAKKSLNRALLFDKENPIALAYIAKIDKILRDLGEEYFYRGVGYFRQKNYEWAKEEFIRALQYSSDLREASSYLQRTIEKIEETREEVESLVREAQLLESRQRYVDATNKYLEALKLDENNEFIKSRIAVLRPRIDQYVKNKYNEGLAHLRSERFLEAQEAFSIVLSIDPNHNGARSRLGEARTRRREKVSNLLAQAEQAGQAGDWRDAHELYAQVARLDPANTRALEGKRQTEKRLEIDILLDEARSHFNSGRYKEAVGVFNRILQLDPNNQVAAVEREAAKSKIEELVEKYFNEGIGHYTLDQYAEAIQAFDKALALDADHEGSLDYKRQAEERIRALESFKQND